ncbi:hypothetical protein KC966_18310, partial [Proteus terrae]|uniref:hypothetical protein n=1 Tax=Proteus terrae TaxID=1574161 RepID=UPI0033157022
MNDIRLRPLAIFFGWTPAKKAIHPSPSNSLRSSDHPLSSLDAHQEKNKKPTALVLLGWSNRFLPQNKFVSFSDFASF